MLIGVMHESIYCDIYIMNEEELVVQICGLHKESKGTISKEPCGIFFLCLWFCW